MITFSSRPRVRRWSTVSFASTLYLCPIIDLLLSEVPETWQPELKLGLQEALVNAATHGNNLDPGKTIVVQFAALQGEYWWVIADQGEGFDPDPSTDCQPVDAVPCLEQECGRGLYILQQVFDQIHWNPEGTELWLCKQLTPRLKLSLPSLKSLTDSKSWRSA